MLDFAEPLFELGALMLDFADVGLEYSETLVRLLLLRLEGGEVRVGVATKVGDFLLQTHQERLKDSTFRLRERDSNVRRAVLNVLMIAGFVTFATAHGPHLHRDTP